jgi:peptidoglycan/xylan/chitin deacetylase (PgdA/CDA1 family)
MKKAKLIIYWDYELQKGADTSTLNYQDGIEDFNQTEFILQHLKKYDIKTCFAVLGHAAEKGSLPHHAPEQIRQIAEEGHEVGSHTYNHKRISRLTYLQLIKELKKSKDTIEKASKTKCTAFVAPWDKPQYLLRKAFDFRPPSLIPRMSKLNFNQICSALKITGYKTYRICPLTSRFNKFKLSLPFVNDNILSIPCRLSNGFGLDAKRLVKKAVENKGLAIIYAHPRGLAHEGPQNRRYFEDFIDYIKKQIDNHNLKVMVPQELI